MKNNLKRDREILKLLKVEYIAQPLLNTSKGLLSLALRKDEDKYHITLDAVPLDEELQAKIMKLYEDIQSK